MVNRTAVVFFASGALLAPSSAVTAQWGGGPIPREGACFYQDANYRSQYFCVEAGADVSAMPSGTNDRVSSIRVFGRVEITVFRDPRFRGESMVIDSNVRDLQSENFNDVISSIQIENRFGGGFRGRGDRPPFGSQQNPDTIVRRAYQDILERDPDPVGMRTYRIHIIDDGWTEQEVRDDLRKSPEYREKNTMTRAKAEEVVRQAYLAVLKREPDQGSQGYVNRTARQVDPARRRTRAPPESGIPQQQSVDGWRLPESP